MGSVEWLRRVYSWFVRNVIGDDAIRKTLPISEQKKVIDSFPEPKDFEERAFFQYMCQKRKYDSVIYIWLEKILNFTAVLPLISLLLFKVNDSSSSVEKKERLALFLAGLDIKDRIPESLMTKYEMVYNYTYKINLTKKDRKLVLFIWKRHPIDCSYVLKIAIKLSEYRGLIDKYRPGAIIVASEDSYTCSILTYFCELNDVRHINIMHGEIFLSLPRAFFQFHAFYVWDSYYRDLLVSKLRGKGDVIVEFPKSFLFHEEEVRKCITYYLQDQNFTQLIHIKEILEEFGKSYKVRPHCLWTDMSLVNKVFSSEHIENPHEISIEQSIMSSECVMAWDSTSLYQAYLNRRKVFIDDITNNARFNYDCEGGYFLLTRVDGENVNLLSSYL